MSFHWNLSSDEENDFDDLAQSDWKDPASSLISSAAGRPGEASRYDDGDEDSSSSEDDDNAATRHASRFTGIALAADEFEDEDDEDVDWEDAAGASNPATEHSETPELAADTNGTSPSTLRPVTLDYNAKDSKDESSKKHVKRIARKRYRFEHLTPDLQYLLSNLEKAHLLGLTAHAIYASSQCSQDESLHIAHSMIPLAWVRTPTSAPTVEDLHSFCNFFFHLVHPWRHQNAATVVRRRRYRRRSKKQQPMNNGGLKDQAYIGPVSVGGKSVHYRIPEYCSFLSTRASAPPESASLQHNFRTNDHVQLFVSMARSLGWRARYVMALDPCKRDLDVDHPLFHSMSTRNVFQRLWKQKKNSTGNIDNAYRPAKRMRVKHRWEGLQPAVPSSGESTEVALESILRLLNPSIIDLEPPVCWVEILCQTSESKRAKNGKHSELHWVHFDPSRELVDTPEAVETILRAVEEGIPFPKAKKKRPIPYALAAEHISIADGSEKVRLADVTPRYASSFVDSLKARGVIRGKQGPIPDTERADQWWTATLKAANATSQTRRKQFLKVTGKTCADAIPLEVDTDDNKKPAAVADHYLNEVDQQEEHQLQQSRQNEPIPTSKTAFKTNPVYTLPSLLNSNEVLKPDAKQRICGVFKGEFVFRRSEVETALPANKWLYKSRKVKDSELSKPITRVKARNRGQTKSFQALKSYGVGEINDGSSETREMVIDAASKPLGDGMEDLYASWQTSPWAPDQVGPNDPIPANEYNNIELALLNPGLVHIDERHVAKVAKKLGIPYVPCLLGFEGHGGNRTPTIRGIVVHQHNEELLREAHEEMASHFLQEEHENKQREIFLRWKRLMVGVLTKERLDQTYGRDDNCRRT